MKGFGRKVGSRLLRSLCSGTRAHDFVIRTQTVLAIPLARNQLLNTPSAVRLLLQVAFHFHPSVFFVNEMTVAGRMIKGNNLII